MAAKRPKRAPLAQRVTTDKALLRRALANPGLRSKLPDRYLSPQQRQQRQLNTRLRQPITPGSTITERDLARESDAAAGVRYGQLEGQQRRQVGEAQTWQRDVGNFYDQYQQQLQARQQAVQDIAGQTAQQLQGTQAGITGLAGADLTQLNQRATADAQARGATPGDVAQMASNATGTRQALLASFAAQQGAKDQANSVYASGLARTVAPAQRLQAGAQAAGRVRQAREKQADTARERGSWVEQYRQEQRAGEAKNILAKTIATGKEAVDLAGIKSRERQTNLRIGSAERQTGARLTSQEQQTKTRLEQQAREGRLNRSNRLKLQKLRDKNKKADTTDDVKPIAPGEAGGYYTQMAGAKGLAQRAFGGRKFDVPPGTPDTADRNAKLDRGGAAKKILSYMGKTMKDPLVVSAGLDAAQLGFISANTVDRLRRAGLDPKRASESLGVPLWQDYKRQHPRGSRPDTAGNPNVARR